MSDVTSPSYPNTPETPPKMRIKDFNSDNSYLPNLTCNMEVRVHISRSSGRSNLPRMTSSAQEWQFQVSYKQINWQIYPRSASRCTPHKSIMGYILWDAFGSHFGFFKKRWEFSLFLNNLSSKQSVSIVEACQM